MKQTFEDLYGINHRHEPFEAVQQAACRQALIDLGFWLKDSIFWFYDEPSDNLVKIGIWYASSFRSLLNAVADLRNKTAEADRLVVLSILARKLTEAEIRWRKDTMRGAI